MNIIHCLFTMETGGAQILAVDIMNRMASLGNQVSLIIINDRYNENVLSNLNPKVKVYKIGRKEGSKNPFIILKLNAIIWRLSPDIIHFHEYNGISVVKFPFARTIYTVHDTGLPTAYLFRYNQCIAISKAVAKDVQKRANIEIPVILNGTNFDLFKVKTDYQLGSKSTFRLVQLSRLVHEKKGQDILLRAFANLVVTYPFITLDFIGSGSSLEYLKALAVELKVESNVNFLGEKSRVWICENLKDYHMLVQPSIYEGFGLTIIEGLIAGLPVLTSNIEGPLEIVSDLDAGWDFETGNVRDCINKITEIYYEYLKGDMKNRVQNSHSIIQDKYSIQRNAEQYLSEYASII